VPRRATRATFAALGLLLAVPSIAHAARTDVLVLKNGDHLTCEVIQMRRAKLQVKTDDAGTVAVEWDKVASLTTADVYEVVMRDGSQLLGRFRPAPPASLQVVAEGGAVTPALMAEIASFARIKTRFLQRIDGSLDLGASYTKSSGVAELFFNASAKYRRPSYSMGTSFSTNLTRQPEAPDTSRYALKAEYTRYRGANWLLSGLGFFESNPDLGFSLRGTGAVSVGRFLVRSGHVELLLAGGLAGGRETPVDGSRVTNVDALIATNLSVFSYDYPSTGLDFSLLVFPSLDDMGRVRLNADAKLKQELFRDFFVSVTAYDAFDNRPKGATAARNDFGGSLSFGWTF
jgi:Protein of unknown function, DUF481